MKNFAIEKLKSLGINPDELLRYDEPHRFYHNWGHIEKMLIDAKSQNILSDELFLAIVFHDIIYDPKSKNNERLSAKLLSSYVYDLEIKRAILDTETHLPTNSISQDLCRLDKKVLFSDYKTFIDFEHKIFKEYQFVDYKKYKEARIKILEGFSINPEYINYVENRKPNIAVYAGSFNPFHKGHYDILLKAEQIFDKVIIARGKNTGKQNELYEFPKSIQYRQIETYDGLLTDFIDSLNYYVTLIRGLRNSTDLQYELTQYRFLQDLKPNIKVVSIFCDKEYEHISSSAIRQLSSFGKESNYLI